MNKILSILIIISIAFLSISMVSAADADHAITTSDNHIAHKTYYPTQHYNSHGPNPDVQIGTLWEHMTLEQIIEMEQNQ